MRSGAESVRAIVTAYKQLAALEATESSVSRNFDPGKGSASTEKAMRRVDSTPRERTEQTLDSVATVLQKRVLLAKAKQEYGDLFVAKPNPEWKAKQDGVLKEIDVSPVEVAFIFGYTSDRPVRELRIRNGRDQHTGRIPHREEQPLTSRRMS